LCDTLRADHLSCYGYHRQTSPFIDSLSKKGLLFENCYSVASRTGPAVSSLFTSLYPSFHGAINSIESWDCKAVLKEERITMAEIFSNNGFDTYAVFSNINASPIFGYAQGFKKYVSVDNPIAQNVTREALKIISDRNSANPFFLYVHFLDPHSPYTPPKPYNNYFDKDYTGKISGASHGQLDRIIAGKEQASPRDIEHLIAQYDAEILYFDQQLQALFKGLESQGLLDNSLILFTADHGEEFFDHGKLLHGYTLFQEQLRVPLIILGKGLPVKRIVTPVSLIDLLPTILRIFNIPRQDQFQGRDLNPLIYGKTIKADPLFAEASLKAVLTIKFKSVIQGDWKYIYDFLNNAEELYNLREDPKETTNLINNSPSSLAQLRKIMREYVKSAMAVGNPQFKPIDKITREQLKALGYIN
jgi:arylsulfatase A-like enzyme